MDRGVFEAAVRRSLYGSASDADNLFARGVDGDYKQPDVQFAWWAFQIGGARVADSLTSKKLESVARAICLVVKKTLSILVMPAATKSAGKITCLSQGPRLRH